MAHDTLPRQREQPRAPGERSLGLPQSTALIIGSIIGVGIFSLPYSLAGYGPISLSRWPSPRSARWRWP